MTAVTAGFMFDVPVRIDSDYLEWTRNLAAGAFPKIPLVEMPPWRSIPSALQANNDSGVTTLARCWTVTLRDGVVLGFTDHDSDLAVGGRSSPRPRPWFTVRRKPLPFESFRGRRRWDLASVSCILNRDVFWRMTLRELAQALHAVRGETKSMPNKHGEIATELGAAVNARWC